MAFAGVSLIADGKLCPLTASLIDARADRGYHLLVVEGFSRCKDTPPNGEYIKSRTFLVGGRRWHLNYYPNGSEEDIADFISVFLVLDDKEDGEEVNAQAVFSFIDQPELRTSTRICKNKIPRQYRYGEQFITRDILERSRHLKDDSFIIRCDIVVVKAPADASTDDVAATTSLFVTMPPTDMQSPLTDLLLSKLGADVTFEVGGETFISHRCVLAARSTVFKELLFVGTTMTKTNIVEINDIEPEIFKNLLVFIYTDSFPDWDWNEDKKEDRSGEQENEEDDEMVYEEGDGSGEEEEDSREVVKKKKYVMWLLKLLETGDRYDIQRLKSICAEELVQFMCRNTVADIIVVAERRRCTWLKDSCVEFIKSHSRLYTALTADSVDQIIRTCSPSVLKELLFKFAT